MPQDLETSMETSLPFSIYAHSLGDLIHAQGFKIISPDIFHKLQTSVASSQFNIFTGMCNRHVKLNTSSV